MSKALELDKDKFLFKNISIDSYNEMCDFCCANSSMESFLKTEAYYYHIQRKASTTLVYYQDRLAAYYTLQRLSLPIELGETEGVLKEHLYSLDLARLAVAQEFQSNGIGTYIVKHIIDLAYKVNDRFITTDALYEKWEWYHELGFNYLKEDEILSETSSTLVYMLMDLYDPKLLEEYFDE